MPTPDVETIKMMLVILEHTLTTLDKASAAATVLISAQQSGKPLSAATLLHYERHFQEPHRAPGAHAGHHSEMVGARG